MQNDDSYGNQGQDSNMNQSPTSQTSSGYGQEDNSNSGSNDGRAGTQSHLNEDQLNGNAAGGYGGGKDFSNSGARTGLGESAAPKSSGFGGSDGSMAREGGSGGGVPGGMTGQLEQQGIQAAEGFTKKEGW